MGWLGIGTGGKVLSQFDDALKTANFKIKKYDPSKIRTALQTNKGVMGVEKFGKQLIKDIGTAGYDLGREFMESLSDVGKLTEMIEEHATASGAIEKEKTREIPDTLKGLRLNCNMAAKGREERFFLSTDSETVSPISGEFYLLAHNLQPADAVAMSRHVVPEYMPRKKPGVFNREVEGVEHQVFNMYTPPPWRRYDGKSEDKLPELFERLVRHLFPVGEEREFFYSWLHDSLFKRAYTFLVLCSAPGTGKNRLKLVMRALHGHVNTVDGKRSTLVERFNSQLSESTLAWFDELKYDVDMENMMKELQNDSISIERKGVDATRATKIHASIVISNNKPRDNYLAFDARKFAPLVVSTKRLEASMTPKEITKLTDKVEDETKPTYDVEFIAQIARWLKNNAGGNKKFQNNEYRGPMFWTLAHTSMTRWQKKAAMLILETGARPSRTEYDPKKGFLWSSLSDKSQRKNGDRSLMFPDHTSVKAFFEVFKDSRGRKAFETVAVKDSIMGDFYVRSLFKTTEIITEASVTEQRGRENAKNKGEKYDL